MFLRKLHTEQWHEFCVYGGVYFLWAWMHPILQNLDLITKHISHLLPSSPSSFTRTCHPNVVGRIPCGHIVCTMLNLCAFLSQFHTSTILNVYLTHPNTINNFQFDPQSSTVCNTNHQG